MGIESGMAVKLVNYCSRGREKCGGGGWWVVGGEVKSGTSSGRRRSTTNSYAGRGARACAWWSPPPVPIFLWSTELTATIFPSVVTWSDSLTEENMKQVWGMWGFFRFASCGPGALCIHEFEAETLHGLNGNMINQWGRGEINGVFDCFHYRRECDGMVQETLVFFFFWKGID